MWCGMLIDLKLHADVLRVGGVTENDRPTVVITGSGLKRFTLFEMAESLGVVIRSLGSVPPAGLLRSCSAVDTCIHPSAFDPHPLAISEAILCGFSVLVSDRLGSWGPSGDDQAGLKDGVFPLGDVNALAALISGLQSDPVLRSRYSARSKRISLERQAFAYQVFADALVELAR